jgi:hypothetical protein
VLQVALAVLVVAEMVVKIHQDQELLEFNILVVEEVVVDILQ